MRINTIFGLLCASVLFPASQCNAGANSYSKILIHLMPVTSTNACTRVGATPYCDGIVTHGSLLPSLYFAHILVVDGDATAGIGAVQCGIAYDGAVGSGVEVYSWNLCADAESTSTGWPASGGGNRITWNAETNCQRSEPGPVGTGAMANAGYFYVGAYSDDYLNVTARPGDGIASVTDCSGVTDIIEGADVLWLPAHTGSAGFGSYPGYNPCGLWDGSSPCGIFGDSVVVEGTTNSYYAYPSSYGIPSWTISGNATIAGPFNLASVQISAGAPGTFTLTFFSDPSVLPPYFVCRRTIRVVAQVATHTTTWSAIKSLYRQ